MRRSSLLMLAAAIVLGLVAVFVARYFLMQQSGPKTAALPTVPAVVASQAIAFGEKLTAEKLKVVQYPTEGLPAGTFQRVVDAAGNDKVALRAIEPNELVTDKALSGKAYRLAAAKLFEPEMRAVAIPINEQSGVAGHIVAGDRVDVFMTRVPDEGQPFAEQLVQNVRVLAVGQNPDVGREKPDLTRTITLEVTPPAGAAAHPCRGRRHLQAGAAQRPRRDPGGAADRPAARPQRRYGDADHPQEEVGQRRWR